MKRWDSGTGAAASGRGKARTTAEFMKDTLGVMNKLIKKNESRTLRPPLAAYSGSKEPRRITSKEHRSVTKILQQEAYNVNREYMESFDQPAYHGSPHRFMKFSLDHIGTGEGTQA
jgi:hypothetical protein